MYVNARRLIWRQHCHDLMCQTPAATTEAEILNEDMRSIPNRSHNIGVVVEPSAPLEELAKMGAHVATVGQLHGERATTE
jgi:hypothetical protein